MGKNSVKTEEENNIVDFVTVKQTYQSKQAKKEILIYPDFKHRASDIVLKGGSMYAFWDGLYWNRDESALVDRIDKMTWDEYRKVKESLPEIDVGIKSIMNQGDGVMSKFRQYEKDGVQSDVVFNTKIIFTDDPIRKEDYATGRLPYTPSLGSTEAFDELYNTLYEPDELEKILWFVGATLTNDISKIEKFMYLYGGKGTGKGTVIRLIKLLFEGYWAGIDLQTLTSNDAFATHQVQEVPVLIDEDTDISKIAKDTNLLKLTSHEPLMVNQKYRTPYDVKFQGLLIAASNQRFKVRNVDSGIVRRAVVVEPSRATVRPERYSELMEQLKFELPHIAKKCIDVYNEKGRFYYEGHVNIDMIRETDHIFEFMREHHHTLSDEVTLNKAAGLYKIFLEDIGFSTDGYKRKLKIEMQRYYTKYYENARINGERHRNVFKGLRRELIFPDGDTKDRNAESIDDLMQLFGLDEQVSRFDVIAKDYPAQLTTDEGTPKVKWDNNKTTLKDILTNELHFVQLPPNHIVIDFDIKNDKGEKDIYLNLEEARKYPRTYTETSKSGNGLHLHYIWEGDPSVLAHEIREDVEIKVSKGNSSLRRKLKWCNDLEIARLSSGLPFKEDEQMRKEVEEIMWTEKKLRTMVEKNLRKEYHSATKPSVDFIAHILKRAEDDGVKYDLSDMRQHVFLFAMSSTNNSKYCLDVVKGINFNTVSEDILDEPIVEEGEHVIVPDEELVFYDVEVFPNLFVIAFKKKGQKGEIWYNPSSEKVESLVKSSLVGFNTRRYDNHMIYGAMLGKSNLELFHQSKNIINNVQGGTLSNAWDLHYADIFEYNSKKQSLKKWEIEMGIRHDELEFPWDQPVAEEDWPRVGQYCMNDVVATEKLFDETYYDYKARLILSEISGLPINATTGQHAARVLFGDDPRPQEKFIYTELSEQFPGYTYSYGKSEYRGEDPSEGGYVHSEPGVHENVSVFDVRSMHPYSAINLNYFGPYTQIFLDLIETRVAIKNGDFDKARQMYDGRLAPYLEDESDAEDLSYALKIIINIVYGFTSAKFDNKFRHPNNKDNIIAKRGALFMIDLKNAVQEKGYTVAHIKTDSIKIPNADEDIKKFVFEFGEKYGYVFEHEATYEKMALINKAVLVAKYKWADKEKKIGTWDAVGAQFAEPFVFKTLFSKEPIELKDYAITKSATAPIHINDRFIGKVAQVYASKTGGEMKRVDGDKVGAITGTKGFKWKLFSEMSDISDVDMEYYNKLVVDAIEAIDKVGSALGFIDEIPKPMEELLLPF